MVFYQFSIQRLTCLYFNNFLVLLSNMYQLMIEHFTSSWLNLGVNRSTQCWNNVLPHFVCSYWNVGCRHNPCAILLVINSSFYQFILLQLISFLSNIYQLMIEYFTSSWLNLCINRSTKYSNKVLPKFVYSYCNTKSWYKKLLFYQFSLRHFTSFWLNIYQNMIKHFTSSQFNFLPVYFSIFIMFSMERLPEYFTSS